RGTVSRYLNGGHWVSESSAEAVRTAIEKTGYVASSTARQLRTGRSGTVAFLVDEEPAAFFGDPTFESLVASVSDALAARDMSMWCCWRAMPSRLGGPPGASAAAVRRVWSPHRSTPRTAPWRRSSTRRSAW